MPIDMGVVAIIFAVGVAIAVFGGKKFMENLPHGMKQVGRSLGMFRAGREEVEREIAAARQSVEPTPPKA